jgi:hypothetical protein
LAPTQSQVTPRDDDRELQTEQTILGLLPRKLQPDRMDTRSWFGMTFAKESATWCTMAAVRFRRTSPLPCAPEKVTSRSDLPTFVESIAGRRFVEVTTYALASRLIAS